MIGNFFKKISTLISKIESKTLKIDSVEENVEKGLLFLTLRINGKCTPPIKKMPYELLIESGSQISSMLSKEDFNLLISTMLENQKRIIKKQYTKMYELINHRFSELNNEPLIVYKNLLTDQYYMKSAKEVFTTIHLIQQFDSQDCACIGNIVGSYETEKELKSHKIIAIEKINNIIKLDNSVLMNQ